MLLSVARIAPLECFTALAAGTRRAGRSLLSNVRNAPHPAKETPRTAACPAAPQTCAADVRRAVQTLAHRLAHDRHPAASHFARWAEDSRPATLGTAELTALRHACASGIAGIDSRSAATGLARMRMQALADHAALGLMQIRVAQSQQRWCERLQPMAVPGAQQYTRLSLSARAAAGFSVAGTGTTAGVGSEAWAGPKRSCFETLEYAQGWQMGATARVSADSALPAVDVGAGASISQEYTRYVGAASVSAFAAHRGRRAVATPLRSRIAHRIRRIASLGSAAPGDRVANAAGAALRWQPMMPALMAADETNDTAACASPPQLAATSLLPSPPPMLDVRLRSRTVSLQAKAEISRFTAAAGASRSRLRVAIDVPLWLPAATLDEQHRGTLAQLLRERLLTALGPKAPRLAALVQDTQDAQDAQDDAAPAYLALQRLHAEFHCLQALLLERQRRVDRTQLDHVVKRICRDWNCSTAQQALARMHDLAQWLWLVLPPGQRAEARALAATLLASPVLRQTPKSLLPFHAHQPMQQFIRADTVELGGGASLPTGGVGLSAALTRTHQRNYNALRDGHYLEVNVVLQGTVDVSALLTLVQRCLPGSEGMGSTAGELQQVLQDITPLAAEGSSSVTLGIRFFRPSFQDDPRFPAAARGMRLQQVTVRRQVTAAVGGRLPVLTAALGWFGAGAQLRRTHQEILRQDVFCSDTLTATLLRYQSLIGQGLATGEAWQHLVDHHLRSLQRLSAALCRQDAGARAEAQYWLGRQRAERGCPLPPGADLLPRFHTHGDNLPRLQMLFDAMLPALARSQQHSPLCHPIHLHGMKGRGSGL